MKRILIAIAIMAASVTMLAEVMELDITLPAAGTLKDYITPEQQETVTKLKVSGDINGDDLRIIRHMIGAQVSSSTGLYAEVDSGACRVLDLADANIIGEGFYTYEYVSKPKQGPPYYLPGLEVEANTITYAMFCGSKVETLILPNSVTYIGCTHRWTTTADHCIDGSHLKSVTLPAQLEHMAIYGTGLALRHRDEGPDYYEEVPQQNLLDSPNLAEVNIDDSNPNFSVYDGVLYNGDLSQLLRFPPRSKGWLNIPTQTQSIARYSCKGIFIANSLDLNVKYVAKEAFINSTIKGKLTLSKEVERIGFAAFIDSDISEVEISGNPIFETEKVRINGIPGYYYLDECLSFDNQIEELEASLAFAYNKGIKAISMPCIEIIPKALFYESSLFDLIDFNEMKSLNLVDELAFFNCVINKIVFSANSMVRYGYASLYRRFISIPREVYIPSSIGSFWSSYALTPNDRIFLWLSDATIGDLVGIGFSWLPYGINYVEVFDRARQYYYYRSKTPEEAKGSGYLYIPKGMKPKFLELTTNLNYYNLYAYIPYENWIEVEMGEFPEVTFSGIESFSASNSVREIARYDINGHPLSKPTQGINIVRYSDGTVKKEFVK